MRKQHQNVQNSLESHANRCKRSNTDNDSEHAKCGGVNNTTTPMLVVYRHIIFSLLYLAGGRNFRCPQLRPLWEYIGQIFMEGARGQYLTNCKFLCRYSTARGRFRQKICLFFRIISAETVGARDLKLSQSIEPIQGYNWYLIPGRSFLGSSARGPSPKIEKKISFLQNFVSRFQISHGCCPTCRPRFLKIWLKVIETFLKYSQKTEIFR